MKSVVALLGWVVFVVVPFATFSAESHVSPHQRFQVTEMGQVVWTGGFWGERFELCHDTILPEMKKALEDPTNGARLSNFLVGAGLEQGKHEGTNWGDGDCYKWIEAMAHVYSVDKDPALDREMDYWIDLIARTQDDDGYIGTQTQLNPEKQRWGMRPYHELYNMGHLMTAAAVHHRATGKDNFLKVAVKLADYLDSVFRPRPDKLAHFGWNPSNIMGLVDLYRVTGERRYLELAGIFVDMRGSKRWPTWQWGAEVADDPHPGDQNQDRVALRKETEAVGHAVTAGYLYCGAADVVAETGEKELADALERIWHSIADEKMYVTGAIGAYHHGVSSRNDKVHEAFGRPFELPNRTAYNETCANISNGMFNRRMLMLTGEGRFGDVMERVVYNSGLSPMSLDGTQFCYCNPLARHYDLPLLNHDTETRWRTARCYCCPPNVARRLAGMHEWAYGLSEGAVWLNLYGSSRLDAPVPGAGEVELVQQTDYPWAGRVCVTIKKSPGAPFELRWRIPGWAEGFELAVNGKPVAAEMEKGYAVVRRIWKAGDEVVLELPMEVAIWEAHPRVEEARNQVAVSRGPLIYCLESIDLPDGVSIDDVVLPRDAEWTVQHDSDLLGGVSVLKTEALIMSPTDESQKLYRRFRSESKGTVAIQMIPYYAWNNREKTEMSVWLPVR